MIINHEFYAYDPYLLSGEQLTFNYGIIAYPLAGLLWFVFSYFTIDVLMAVITVIDFILLSKLLKKHSILLSIILLSLSFHVAGDTYVAHFSNMLFWWGVYSFYRKKRFWQVPIILACINHPAIIAPAAYFILKDKKLLAVIGVLLAYFVSISYFFAQSSSFHFYLFFVFLFRLIICLSPVILIEDFFGELKKSIQGFDKMISRVDKNYSKKFVKKSEENINVLRKIVFFKIPLIYVILIVIATIILTQNIIYLIFFNTNNLFLLTSLNQVQSSLFNGFPNISGEIRTIDYLWLPSLIYFNENITLTEGSFRENNVIKIENEPFYWSNRSEYSFFVQKDSFDYVLFCKLCSPPTNEKEFLDDYYSLVWENEYYYLYSVS